MQASRSAIGFANEFIHSVKPSWTFRFSAGPSNGSRKLREPGRPHRLCKMNEFFGESDDRRVASELDRLVCATLLRGHRLSHGSNRRKPERQHRLYTMFESVGESDGRRGRQQARSHEVRRVASQASAFRRLEPTKAWAYKSAFRICELVGESDDRRYCQQ